MQKTCLHCSQTKWLTDFTKQSGNKDGHQSICKPCVVIRNRNYWRTPVGRMSQIYAVQCVTSRARRHTPPAYTREQLTEWAFQNGLDFLVIEWQRSGYSKDLSPSVDRLDDAQGYSFSNIRLVHWKDNNEKMYTNRKSGVRITAQNRRVEQLTKDGQHVAFHVSVALAARVTGGVRTNINTMCAGTNPHIKSVKGFMWRYA